MTKNNKLMTKLLKTLEKRRAEYLREKKDAAKGNEGRLYAHAHNCNVRASVVLGVTGSVRDLDGPSDLLKYLKLLDKERIRRERWAREDAKVEKLIQAHEHMTASWELSACMELIAAAMEE